MDTWSQNKNIESRSFGNRLVALWTYCIDSAIPSHWENVQKSRQFFDNDMIEDSG